MKKVKGLRNTSKLLQKSHRDVKYNIGNIVNNIVITMYDASWILEITEGTLLKYIIV